MFQVEKTCFEEGGRNVENLSDDSTAQAEKILCNRIPRKRSKTPIKDDVLGLLLHLADHVSQVSDPEKSSRHLLLLDFSRHMNTKRIPDPSQVRLNGSNAFPQCIVALNIPPE